MATLIRSPFRGNLLLVCTMLALASACWGAPVFVQVTGKVITSDFTTIGVGTSVTGLYTYDDALSPWHMSGPDLADYFPITAALSFDDGSVGGATLSSDESIIFVNNNSSGLGTYDEYGMDLDLNRPSGTRTGAFAEGEWEFMLAGIRRHDPTGTAWDGIALPDPETILALLPDDSSFVYFHETSWGTTKFIQFEATDLLVVPAPVPLPGAVVLGVIGVGCCRRLFRRGTV